MKKINLDKLFNVLIVVILIFIIAICVALAVKCASKPSSGVENPTDGPGAIDSPEGTPGDAATHSYETPGIDETPGYTPPAESQAPISNIPLAVTEGALEDVYTRLEQLKALKAQHPEAIIILLDVGHGGFDPGASGAAGSVESLLNLETARYVAEKLAEKGYYVFMTRMGEYAVADSKSEDMAARAAMMKNDIFTVAISIHMNSFPRDPSVKGVRVYHYPSSSLGNTLASLIMREAAAATEQQERETSADDLMVVREPVCPSALIECGFISNAEEERKLQSPEYQEKLAQGIADGVEAFIRLRQG